MTDKDDGFTLLELLISLSLMSLMAMIILATLDFGRLSLSYAQKAQSNTADLIARLDARNLVQLYDPALKFTGTADNITFQLNPSDHSQSELTTTITLGFRPDGNKFKLVLTTQTTSNTVLESGLSGIKISYFGHRNNDQTAKWHLDWPAFSGALKLVKFEATKNDGTPFIPLTIQVASQHPIQYFSIDNPIPNLDD